MDTEHLDRSIAALESAKGAWLATDIEDQIDLLRGLRTKTAANARRWVDAAAKAKGLALDSPLAGEEWLAGPYGMIDAINAMEATLTRIASGSDVLEGFKASTNEEGQVTVEVLPASASDRLLFSGSTAEVWMQPDVTLESLPDTVALLHREPPERGAVCLILGAGNVASIPPLDAIYKLYNERQVAIVKMNPVNEYLGEIFETIFEDFIAADFIRFVYGGGDVGAYLTSHPGVETIHITGAARTYNTIRYGAGEEGERNRIADTPVNARPISAELGGVSPTIVVPGDWSRADLAFQADHIVTQKMNNSGFNCVAAQVLILPESWDLTDVFLDEIRSQLRDLPERDAYYPGAKDRCEAVIHGSGTVEVFGSDENRILVTDIDPSATDDPTFTTEYFAPALAVVTLPSRSVDEYCAAATDFANDVLEGSLGANIIVHPKTEKAHAGVRKMISALRYGGIGVNTWSASVYLLSRCPWGAYPGNPPSKIGSGTGVVHNTLMFSKTQKAVARAPFAPSHRTLGKGEFHLAPKPVFFVSNTQMHKVGEYLVDYAASGKTADMMKVVGAALRG
ncbi:MAG: aldehyde dehydrogenase family protein [Actinomycetota bacterium]